MRTMRTWSTAPQPGRPLTPRPVCVAVCCCSYSLIDSVSEYKLLIDNFQNTTTCAGYNIKSNTVDYR